MIEKKPITYPQNRLPQIDFLRGVAIILVLFRHKYFVGKLSQVGWIGVDLFFVLSGFLVSGLIFKELEKRGSFNARKFLIRRGFKIYPVFYFFLSVTVLLKLTENHFDTYDFLSELFFIQNYLGHFWNHTWSLAVEEHFYIFIAFMIKVFCFKKKFEPLRIIYLCFAIMLSCLVFRIWNFRTVTYSISTHYYLSHLRFDSLMFGVLISVLYHFDPRYIIFSRVTRMIFYLISLTLIFPVFIWPMETFFVNTFGLSLLYVGFGLILVLFLTDDMIVNRLEKIISFPGFCSIKWIGYYSYSIYLFHVPIRDFLGNFATPYPRLDFIIYAISSIFLGAFISQVLEIPILKYRDRFFPNTAQ